MENLRELQLIELDILKHFISICKTYNLKYFAISGTVLGAVRHKGFIPWDDDIDISMPRTDYNAFCEIASRELKHPFEVKTLNNDNSHLHGFMQIVNKKTTILINSANIKRKYHAHIDIFPTDGLPSNKVLRYIHVRFFLIFRDFFVISVFDERVDQKKKRSICESMVIHFCNKFNVQRLLCKRKRFLAADKILRKYDYYKTNYCSPQLWGLYRTKSVFPTEWLGEGISLPFEDIQIIVPTKYNKYLSQLYGSDYMELPPPEKRSTHSSSIIFNED